MKKKVLVTGGAGFIGSSLCEKLAETQRYDIFSLDNYFTGSADNHVSGVNYIRGDTENIFELIDFSPDYIYHLGEYSRVEQSFDDVNLVFRYNKIGTFKVLQFCHRVGAKLIYAGSSTKFGDGGLGRQQSPYAWTKASNTELVNNFGNWYNIPFAITYFYNVYGPREINSGKYATLIAIFKERMRKGELLNIVSPGTQKRNFTHIADIVDGLILVGENGYGDEFGIGSPHSYTVLEVATLFGGDIQYVPERQGNRMTSDVVTHKTAQLGWKPSRSLESYVSMLRSMEWAD